MEKDFSFIEKNQFVFISLSFLLGVLFASLYQVSVPFVISFVLLGVGIFLYLQYSLRFSKKIFVTLFLCIAFFAVGIVRFDMKDRVHGNTELDSQINKQISITVTIVEAPVGKDTGRDYIVETQDRSARILVHATPYPIFHYGDTIMFTGKLSYPKSFETDNEKIFDYPSYLKKNGVRYLLSFAQGTFVSSDGGNRLQRFLYTVRDSFVANIERSVPEPGASLLTGILLGNDSMPRSIEDSFRRTGIVHIVVLSGYNITIVAESLVQTFSFLPKYFAIGTGIFGIIIFSLMVGGTPSVLRASCMAILVLIAKLTGRTYDVGRALIISGIAMVFVNPHLLVFDTSFQLSFLSTIALIWISPIFERYLEWIPHRFGLREVTCATISTQVFVLPFILLKIGQVSLVGLPVNLIVLAVIPLLMLLGFITGLCGYIAPLFALPFAFLSYGILTYIFMVVHIFDSLPFAAINVPYFGVTMFVVMYLLYLLLFLKINIKKKGAL